MADNSKSLCIERKASSNSRIRTQGTLYISYTCTSLEHHGQKNGYQISTRCPQQTTQQRNNPTLI
ncbi:hypothetical protein PR202_gb26237 [Eleusine coracana subsp. coracana]|uniref:Uncharacterized protein n=1 Tax=Eleusine coracana subsp. coracana TaxID=191504 RepID=A0AAV5FQM7_ELECO|nr:hypothetical protein PR202_gb26237 [Eleusine coracana subsp. coracana]